MCIGNEFSYDKWLLGHFVSWIYIDNQENNSPGHKVYCNRHYVSNLTKLDILMSRLCRLNVEFQILPSLFVLFYSLNHSMFLFYFYLGNNFQSFFTLNDLCVFFYNIFLTFLSFNFFCSFQWTKRRYNFILYLPVE